MKYGPEKHHRRSIRLKDYDYSRCGAYFVTICTQNRICLFGEIDRGKMNQNDAGDAITETFGNLSAYCPGLEVDTFVVMPNHVHIVFVLNRHVVGAGLRACPVNDDDDIDRTSGQIDQTPMGNGDLTEGHPRRGAPTDDGRTTLSDVVYTFKSWTTKRYSDGVKQDGWTAFPGKLWQRNYYERVIRNEDEMTRIREYIKGNPQNWETDEENPNCSESSQQAHATDAAKRRR